MGFLDKAARFLGLADKSQNRPIFTDSDSLQGKLRRSHRYRVELETKKLNNAIIQAESPTLPNRKLLYAVYDEIIRDGHLFSQMRTTRIKVQASPFELRANKRTSEEMKELFEKSWFVKYLGIFADTVAWGHSLVEFEWADDGTVKRIWLTPREHVRPEYHDVLINTHDASGINYEELPNLIEIGDRYDLGLLKIAARDVIYKTYSRSDWSMYSEKFGMPIVLLKTPSKRDKEIDKRETWLQNLGRNGYAILDDNEEFQLAESSKSDNYQVYLEKIKLCNEELSKVIVGQTSTADEKAWVGSAEVHERILNDYHLALLREAQNHINEKLIPFLIENSAYNALEGYKFQFLELEKKAKKEKAAQEPSEESEDEQLDLKKKSTWALYAAVATEQLADKPLIKNIEKLFERVLKRVYNRRTPPAGLDKELLRQTVDKLYEAAEEGAGRSLVDMAYTNPSYELLTQFRENVHVFAAFKTHQQIGELSALLTNPDGTFKIFEEFSKEAEQILGQYNQNWLRTEYNQAKASARMGENWKKYEKRKSVLPMLQYNTAGDKRVRAGHQKLDGVTLPIDDSFWDTYYPPNGWGCRCDVRQVAGPRVEPTDFPTAEEQPRQFQFNPGKTGQLFSAQHPYFSAVTPDKAQDIIKAKNFSLLEWRVAEGFLKDLAKAEGKAMRGVFRKYGDSLNEALGYDNKSGGYVLVHPKHEASSLINELPAAQLLKERGFTVELLEEVGMEVKTDALINGKIYEFKRVSSATNFERKIERAFRDSKKAKRLVLHIDQDFNKNEVQSGLIKAIRKYGDKVEWLWLILNDNVYEERKSRDFLNRKI